ncbi:hypothetical protein [Sphingomonas nostoxanthinifaciens]|uniref:hypothetical protein n=1 Tax=Sphingomonas nostoxanthinifaciens TaxID=2872652 RepID=UPI001CC1CA6A|nr:hypothetical protein [Sphingomonas nostoxanthinifaciens]UAK25724.1 hypothetical protein K8P63_06210 [Sphingomonas nostoxanthinifaciens]
MDSIADVERTQAELDALYGELSARAGDPNIQALMDVLRAADVVVAESKRLATALERSKR